MNWKLVIIGGLVFWVVSNLIGMFVTGIVIHEMILDPIYRAHESFWIPPLRQSPPDMAAVLPFWLFTSLVTSLIVAGIYGCVQGSFQGAGWKKGLIWGFCLALITCSNYLGFSGLFDLPGVMFVWWGVDALIIFLIAGAAMGWAGERFAGA